MSNFNTNGQCVAALLMILPIFSGRFSGVINFVPPVSQTLEGMTYFGTPSAIIRYQMCYFVSKPEHSEVDWGRKPRPYFQIFTPM